MTPPPIARIYRHPFTFPPTAEDVNSHVNNVEYVRLMQDAAIAHTHHNGWPVEDLQKRGWTWVVRSHTIEYLHPCHAGEPLAIYTWVHDFHRIRSCRRYRFVRDSDHLLLARAETDWIFLDIRRNRPISIPTEILSAYIIVPESEETTIGLPPAPPTAIPPPPP